MQRLCFLWADGMSSVEIVGVEPRPFLDKEMGDAPKSPEEPRWRSVPPECGKGARCDGLPHLAASPVLVLV